MKILIFVLAGVVFSTANATIAGPSCEDLNAAQKELLSNAALKYVLTRAKAEPGVTVDAITADKPDCHDYDGVHSSSVFTITWDQTHEDQQMQCVQQLAVEADYDSKKKLKTINKKTKFFVEEASDIECLN
jgi:hypothetical protein